MRARKEKEREREERERELKAEQDERENDFEGWKERMRSQQEVRSPISYDATQN